VFQRLEIHSFNYKKLPMLYRDFAAPVSKTVDDDVTAFKSRTAKQTAGFGLLVAQDEDVEEDEEDEDEEDKDDEDDDLDADDLDDEDDEWEEVDEDEDDEEDEDGDDEDEDEENKDDEDGDEESSASSHFYAR
jgi:hypothetical protein